MPLQRTAFVFHAIRCTTCRQPAADAQGNALRCTACGRYLCAQCRFLRGEEHDCEAEKRAEKQRRRDMRGTE